MKTFIKRDKKKYPLKRKLTLEDATKKERKDFYCKIKVNKDDEGRKLHYG